jgi:tyrosyl-tRNA synthetase
MFGKLLSVSDDLMWRYLELLSFRSLAQIEHWRAEVNDGRNPRDIKVMLAQEIVARFHTLKAAEDALAEFEARFQKGVLPDDMPEISVASADGNIGIAQMLKQAGLVASTSEALRMIDQGGVKLDGEKISDKALQLKAGTVVVAQVGKRKFGRVNIS